MKDILVNDIPEPLSVMRFNVSRPEQLRTGEQAKKAPGPFSSYLLVFTWGPEKTAFAQVSPGHEGDWKIGRKPSLLENDIVFGGPCVTIEEKDAWIYLTLWGTRYPKATFRSK